MKRGWVQRGLAAVVLMGCGIAWSQGPKTITVGAAGADFTTIQAAVNAAPGEGAVIRIRPGVYREVVHVDKPRIQLRGEGDDWTKVVLVYGNSAASTCGTSCSATLFVTGSDMMTTLANQLPRIYLANGGSMQSAEVVNLKSGATEPLPRLTQNRQCTH